MPNQTHLTESSLHTSHFSKDGGGLWTVISSGGGPTYDALTSGATITDDGGWYMVDTKQGAATLTVGGSMTFFTVFDSHFNFSSDNCTVDFGGGSTRVMSLDGEIMTFFKDSGDAWRYISVGVGSGGAV